MYTHYKRLLFFNIILNKLNLHVTVELLLFCIYLRITLVYNSEHATIVYMSVLNLERYYIIRFPPTQII